MTEHPITPPRQLMQQWMADSPKVPIDHGEYIATQAARWSADQELEACINAILEHPGFENPELFVELLRAARRPKPPSLKEKALAELAVHERLGFEVSAIRRALEALPDQP